jgi:hypothetical protein
MGKEHTKKEAYPAMRKIDEKYKKMDAEMMIGGEPTQRLADVLSSGIELVK